MGWHYQNLESSEIFTSIELAAKSVGVHSGSILRAIRKNWTCAGVYWKKLPVPIPSWFTKKSSLQEILDTLRIDGTPRQIVINQPSRYARGKDSLRYYVEIKCSKHGPYGVPKRVDELLERNGTQCRRCGRERQIFLSRRRAVQKMVRWATNIQISPSSGTQQRTRKHRLKRPAIQI